MTRSKEEQDFIDANPDKFKVVSPEETAKTLEKQSGGYFKGQSWRRGRVGGEGWGDGGRCGGVYHRAVAVVAATYSVFTSAAGWYLTSSDSGESGTRAQGDRAVPCPLPTEGRQAAVRDVPCIRQE